MNDEEKIRLKEKFNLDPIKKTILYAPTFFPSSIEKMSLDFPSDFADCNILIKAHYLSYERRRYRGHMKRLQHWEKFDGCNVLPVTEYDLTPLLAISDVMISDESSAMFEFAGLKKPVVSNQYFKLRWSYYLMPWKLKRRIDQQKDPFRQVLYTANYYEETKKMTKKALEHHDLQGRLGDFIPQICGRVDGRVSKRIVDLLDIFYRLYNF